MRNTFYNKSGFVDFGFVVAVAEAGWNRLKQLPGLARLPGVQSSIVPSIEKCLVADPVDFFARDFCDFFEFGVSDVVIGAELDYA